MRMIRTETCCNCFTQIYPDIDKNHRFEFQEISRDRDEREIITKFLVCSLRCLKDLKFRKKNWK